jgi:hypothetical protein
MTPQAARAQRAMDTRRGGYRNREARRMELIAFNDLFVEVVLGLEESARGEFMKRLYASMQQHCREVREPCFSREQYEAIVRGLSREIAVFLAAKRHGYEVHMTSRVADGLGVDMQIRDSSSGRYVNIDCKTPPAFRRRIHDLVREGRLTEAEAAHAVIGGLVELKNGRGMNRVVVVLVRVDEAEFGEIHNFEFTDTPKVAQRLQEIIDLYGRRDGEFFRFLPLAD